MPSLRLSIALTLPLVLSACQPSNPTNLQLSSGLNHSCSLDAKISGVQCWGDNRLGQTQVPELGEVSLLRSGDNFNCAVDESGLHCWGDNQAGQLSPVAPLSDVELLAAGAAHACALDSGLLQCWGANDKGQSKAPKLASLEFLALGRAHSCAASDGKIQCWGDNIFAQLKAPVIAADNEILALTAADNTSCVLLASNSTSQVQCWGERPALAATLSGVENIFAIDLKADNLCVVSREQVLCSGDDAWLLKPRELSLASQIAVGENHACARHQQGVTCWGQNNFKQAQYDGGDKHTLYRAEVVIDATPEQVWAVLMDLDAYPLWNPFTIAMKSELKLGAVMDMKVAMQPWLVLDQAEHIRVLKPNYKVCWGIDTDTGEYSRGERCQWLEVIGPNQTRYITEDLIEGKVTPLVTQLFGASLKRGFSGVAQGLKQRVEALN